MESGETRVAMKSGGSGRQGETDYRDTRVKEDHGVRGDKEDRGDQGQHGVRGDQALGILVSQRSPVRASGRRE